MKMWSTGRRWGRATGESGCKASNTGQRNERPINQVQFENTVRHLQWSYFCGWSKWSWSARKATDTDVYKIAMVSNNCYMLVWKLFCRECNKTAATVHKEVLHSNDVWTSQHEIKEVFLFRTACSVQFYRKAASRTVTSCCKVYIDMWSVSHCDWAIATLAAEGQKQKDRSNWDADI